MKENFWFDIKLEEGWKGLASRSTNQIGIMLHFFIVPFFGLLCYMPHTQEKNIGFAFLNFLRIYLPYALLFGIVAYITGRNFKSKGGKKFDLAVITSGISSGIGFLTFAVLMQSLAILTLFAEFGFTKREKVSVLVVYILVDIVFAIIILKFPKRINDNLNKWSQILNGFFLDSKQNWIGAFLIIIISLIGFQFSGFQEFKNFLLFMSGTLGGFLALFFVFFAYPIFIRIFLWRIRYFRD